MFKYSSVGYVALFVAALTFFGSSVVNDCCAQVKTWTDASGVYKIYGELVLVHEVSGELQAEMLRDDGKRVAIPVAKLCNADKKLAEEFHFEWVNGKAVSEADVFSDRRVNSKSSQESPDRQGGENAKLRRALPTHENEIVSRPLRNAMSELIETESVATVNIQFDPETAVRLERVIERDENGRAIENPRYLIEIANAEFDELPLRFRKLSLLLNDNSTPVESKRRAIDVLENDWPRRRYQSLMNVVINCLSENDKYIRLAALDLVARHDAQNSIHYILARIDDISFDVRWRTFEILAQLRDPRIIPELCERLGSADCRKIASILQVFGSTANPWIHPWLSEDQLANDYLMEICKLLGVTGDFDSIQALSKVRSHQSKLVQQQAQFAIRQIEKRLKATAAR